MTQSKTNNVNTNQANRLSVQVSLTGLSFLRSSDSTDQLEFENVSFKHRIDPEDLTLELNRVLSHDSWKSLDFSEVIGIHASPLYTVVPTALFDPEKASEYLKFNTKILGTDFVSFDALEHFDYTVVYLPFVNANNLLFDRFGSFSYFHSTTLLLNHFLTQEKYKTHTKVYLYIHDGFFDCFVIKQGALQLCNSYSFKTPEDFIYFVLFCFEQLKLNPDDVDTVLCGAVSQGNDLYNILYTYVRNVQFYEGLLKNLSEFKTHEQLILKTSL